MIKNLQLLRLLSCSCILLFHFGPHYSAMGGNNFVTELFKNLYFGTDIFRVISGFILMYVVSNKAHTKSYSLSFLIKRFSRIFVSYYPFAIITAIVFYIFLPDYLQKINWVSSLFLTSINLQELIVPVTWSLAFELYFYILFAIGLFFNVLNKKYLIHFLFIIVLLINVLFPSSGATHFVLSPYMLEFMIGMLVYKHSSQLLKLPIYQLTIMLFVCLVPSVYFMLNEGLARCIGFGLSAGVMLTILLSLEKNKGWVPADIFVVFGSASYIVFLSHYVLINLFAFLGIQKYASTLPPFFIELSAILFITFVFVFSLLYYKLIDLKLYSILLRKVKNLRYRGAS